MIFYLRADMSDDRFRKCWTHATDWQNRTLAVRTAWQIATRRTPADVSGLLLWGRNSQITSLQVSRFTGLNLVLTIQTPHSNDRAKLKAAFESIGT